MMKENEMQIFYIVKSSNNIDGRWLKPAVFLNDKWPALWENRP